MVFVSRPTCVHACSVMSDSATPWTVAYQASMSMGFPVWSQPRDQTYIFCISCTARQIFFFNHWATWEALDLHEKELFLRLYLLFELSLSLSNITYPRRTFPLKNIHFNLFISMGLNSTDWNKHSLRMYEVHETMIANRTQVPSSRVVYV